MKREKRTAGGILASSALLDGREYKIENCYSEFTSSYNEKLHFHDFYELSVIYEGRSHFLVNGTVFSMGKRSIQLIRPRDYHRQQTAEGEHIRYYNLTFSQELLREELVRELELQEMPLCAEAAADEWEALLGLLQRTCRSFEHEPDTLFGKVLAGSCIEIVCAFLLKNCGEMERTKMQTVQEPIRRAIAYVRKNYRERLSLADAAKAAGLSQAYFSSVFHETMGIPFSRYLTEYRLREARRYLQAGALPLKQVAAVCGFSSYSYFISAFKKYFGETPGKVRNPASAETVSSQRFRF